MFALRPLGKMLFGPLGFFFFLLQDLKLPLRESARHHIASPVPSSYNTSMASPIPVRSQPCCSTRSCWPSRDGTATVSSLPGCAWPCLAGTESLDRRKRLKKSQPDYRCISRLVFPHLSNRPHMHGVAFQRGAYQPTAAVAQATICANGSTASGESRRTN